MHADENAKKVKKVCFSSIMSVILAQRQCSLVSAELEQWLDRLLLLLLLLLVQDLSK
jgi:hypothetical protein